MREEIRRTLLGSSALLARVAEEMTGEVAAAAEMLIAALRAGHTVAFCGNGGSAADAQHLAGELVGRFVRERQAFSALALNTDTAILTAIGNDYGFQHIFARQVEGLLRPGDVLVALSTSGNAPDCVEAARVAQSMGVKTLGLTGEGGGLLAQHCDLCLMVPHTVTARIQEAHIALGHVLCALVEDALWEEAGQA